MCEALTFLLHNIYKRFGSKLYRQIVDIPIGTNCAPLVAGLFLFCYERDFLVVLGWAYRGLTGGFLLLQNFSVAISVSPHVCFILVLILISVLLR